MEGDMDSITKADGMESVRLVRFPGSVRVVLDDNALALIADALEDAAARTDWAADGPRAALLAEVLRGSEVGSVELGTGRHVEGRDPDRAHALVQALVDAGAQA
jgi:hypothetical protein